MPTKPHKTQHPSRLQPRATPYKTSYGKNLFLLIELNGGKYWSLDYRFKQLRKTLALGVYPRVSMDEAIALRDEVIAKLANGIDPAEERRAAKAARPKAKRRALRFIMSDAGALTIETLAAEIHLTTTQTQTLIEFLAQLVGEHPCR